MKSLNVHVCHICVNQMVQKPVKVALYFISFSIRRREQLTMDDLRINKNFLTIYGTGRRGIEVGRVRDVDGGGIGAREGGEVGRGENGEGVGCVGCRVIERCSE